MEEFAIFLLVVVIVIAVLVVTASQSRKHAARTDYRLCKSCGMKHPAFAEYCRHCGQKLG